MKRILWILCLMILLTSCKAEDSLKSKIIEDIQDRYTHEHKGTPYSDNVKVIGLMSKYTGDPFLDTVLDTCQEELAKAGMYSIMKSPPSYLDPIEEQLKILNEYIISEVDGIIMIPNDEIALNAMIAEATRQGIFIVIVDTPVDLFDLEKEDVVLDNITFVKIDNYAAAYSALSSYSESLSNQLNCLLINGDLSNPNAVERMEGFKKAIIHNSKLELVSETSGNWQENLAYHVVIDELGGLEKIDLIICANDRMAFGTIQALIELKLSDDILVTGFDGTKDAVAMVESGVMEFTVLQSPIEFGMIASNALNQLMNGTGKMEHIINSTLLMKGVAND